MNAWHTNPWTNTTALHAIFEKSGRVIAPRAGDGRCTKTFAASVDLVGHERLDVGALSEYLSQAHMITSYEEPDAAIRGTWNRSLGVKTRSVQGDTSATRVIAPGIASNCCRSLQPSDSPHGKNHVGFALRTRITHASNGRYGVTLEAYLLPYLAPSVCSYVQLAVRLGRDARYRQWASDLIDQRSPALWERRGVVLEWARFISRAAGRAPPTTQEVK